MDRDLFNGAIYKPTDEFRWVVAKFNAKSNGAPQVMRRANKIPLMTFFPLRYNRKGEPVALWGGYLFIEWREGVTINLCKTTNHFICLISARDNDGIIRPILSRRNAIDETMHMLMSGRFDERPESLRRARHYRRGAVVIVLDGIMHDRKVRLEQDIPPDMKGTRKVCIDISGVKGQIEVSKLALV
jgi:hypothetical protein